MEIELGYSVQHVFILGAGASTDYGLPVWRDLARLIKARISSDKGNVYQHKKEILTWIDEVGEDKKHRTLDECIRTESISDTYPDGDSIEDQVFLIMKDIFNDHYKNDAAGWMRKLNNTILQSDKSPEQQIAFINFNYDRVLEDLLLNYSYLHRKLRRNTHRERLEELMFTKINVLYPHGNLYKENELGTGTHTQRRIETIKSYDISQIDAVTCFESKKHAIYKPNRVSKFNLYILGLGAGLEVNLDNIKFGNPISEIHLTARHDDFRDSALNFLSKKYKVPTEKIQTYASCTDLIEKCFPPLNS